MATRQQPRGSSVSAAADNDDEEANHHPASSCGGCCSTFQKTISDLVLTTDEDKLEYLTHYNCAPPPLFSLLVCLTELVVFVYYGVSSHRRSWLSMDAALVDSPLIYDPYRREEAWRFLSYMLLHADLEHVLGNVLLQLTIGVMLEMVHKSTRVVIVFMSGVLAGSLASSIFDPYVFLCGASGGVYALFGGFLVNVILNWSRMAFNGLHLVAISVIVVTDLGFSIWRRLAFDEAAVSLTAHIAGGLAGISIGSVAFRSYKQDLSKDLSWWVSIGSYIFMCSVAVLWNMFLSPVGTLL